MKLSEIPYRDYVAMEVLPQIIASVKAIDYLEAGTSREDHCAVKAFKVADAFLRAAGKEERRVQDAEARAEKAEIAHGVTECIHLNMGGDFPARAALTQIWAALGADNQTAAMTSIDELLAFRKARR